MNRFSVTLLVTEQCNLRCTYCYEKFIMKGVSEEVERKIQLLFKNLSDSHEEIHISFFGGEPMLAYKHIERLMEHNSQLDCKFDYSMTTNGTLLSTNKLNYLTSNGLDQFQITLDGVNASHDAQRISRKGEGTFKKIYGSLLDARRLTTSFRCIIRVNVSPGNAKDMTHLANMIHGDFGNDERFKVLFRPVGKWGGENDDNLEVLSPNDFKNVEREFWKIVPEHMKFSQNGNKICYAAMPNHLLVYPDGRLGKCTVGLHDEKNSIGYIGENGEVNVESEGMAFWSRGFITGNPRHLSCPYWSN